MVRRDVVAIRVSVVGLLLLPFAAAAGGTVVRMEGRGTIERSGEQLPAEPAAALQSGDTLRVAPDSKAQIRFEDDSVFAIPGAAQLHVDEFRLGTRGKGGKAIYTLAEGGLRTITGRVGKGANDVYELRTAMATVNVKGSAYSSLLCAKQCGDGHKPGLYVRAETGIIVVANGAGRLQLRVGQVAYAESQANAPVLVRVSPFSDPIFAAEFGMEVDFNTEIHPPRIEPEQPASPS